MFGRIYLALFGFFFRSRLYSLTLSLNFLSVLLFAFTTNLKTVPQALCRVKGHASFQSIISDFVGIILKDYSLNVLSDVKVEEKSEKPPLDNYIFGIDRRISFVYFQA